MTVPASPVAACHASAKASAMSRLPRTPVRPGRVRASSVATTACTSIGIPLHANGYGGVCSAAPTAVPSSHTDSRSASSPNLSARSRVSSMVLVTGSRRYSGSAIARNSSADSCIRTSTQSSMVTDPGWRRAIYTASVHSCTGICGVSRADTHARGARRPPLGSRCEVRRDWTGAGRRPAGR